MSRYKRLLKRVERLERQNSHFTYESYDYYKMEPIKALTTMGKLEAITEHLGLEESYTPSKIELKPKKVGKK